MEFKCNDCGKVFDGSMTSCPECGCPVSYCSLCTDDSQNTVMDEEIFTYNDRRAATTRVKESTDWANYIYECGVLYWQTLTMRYATFSGRASRREFWSFTILSSLLGFTSCIGIFLLILPTIAVAVRRMHDINKSGWWSICPIASFFLFLKRSDSGENRFGYPMIYDNQN